MPEPQHLQPTFIWSAGISCIFQTILQTVGIYGTVCQSIAGPTCFWKEKLLRVVEAVRKGSLLLHLLRDQDPRTEPAWMNEAFAALRALEGSNG